MGRNGIENWSDYLIGALVIILFCVTLLLNILALHYTYSKIRKPSNKKIPHLLVGALSLGGLGIALFEYPPFIASRFKGEWLNESGVCSFVAFIIVFFGNLTICLVVLMSLERLGAIVFPFFYKEHVSFRKAVIVVVLVIIYSIVLASLPIFLNRIRLNVATGICTYTVDSYNTNTRIVVAVMVTHYIASIVLMFISNMIVVRTVSKLDKNTMSDEYSSRCGERKQHGTNACLNFAKMVGVLAFCYTICWTVILMRILLRYVYGWTNYYYDQVVIVLTTFDPLINHCVCLWIMRKYRDGYASSMGSLVSCFKISDDGIWATTITRLSTMSRRSTYSRASTRSSSRQPSKPYVYKQVPQIMDPNQQPDLLPDCEDIQEQQGRLKPPENDAKNNERICSEKRIYSDTKKEWSDLIKELNAEKNEKTSPRVSADIEVIRAETSYGVPQRTSSKQYKTKSKWLDILAKHKAEKQNASGKGIICTTIEPPRNVSRNAPKTKDNLPELLNEIRVERNIEKPELLRDGTPRDKASSQKDIPEILQDIASSTNEGLTEEQTQRHAGLERHAPEAKESEQNEELCRQSQETESDNNRKESQVKKKKSDNK